MGSYVLLILTSILSSSLSPVCPNENNIAPDKSISANQTIISAGGNFALGFFSPGNSTNTYLGIWYNTIPKQTVIWVANRENPIPEKNSQAVLTLSSSGNLVLFNGSRQTIWSSNVPTVNSSVNSTSAVLLDNGNLVLRQGDDDTVLWQSFDYPTDTFMPGMKISLNRKTGRQNILTSWADDEDPRPGMFSVGIDTKGRPQFYIWKQHDPYWRSNVPDGSLSQGGYYRLLGFAFHLTYVLEGDEPYLTYNVSDDSIKLKFTLTPSGQVEVLLWKQSTWLVLVRVPVTACDFYGHCGPFGSCEQNGPILLCKCLTGFEPKIEQDWVIGNWTRGCVRRTALRCDNKGDVFMKIEKMKLPDYSIWLGNMSISECEFKCLRNCSCTAYAYANVSGETSVNCYNWFGDLMDLVHNHVTGQDLYVRLHGSEVGGNGQTGKSMDRKRSLIAIAAATLLIGLLLISGVGYVFRRKWLRWQERINGSVHVVNSMSSTSGVGQNDTELLSFSLQTILSATDNFSEENKLGEGGFGPVYKGNFPGIHKVAMKRLSKYSLQGFEEFMTELKLIAKLQHTNLVRLMGCCIEGEEKILIYEFMPNRSLDKFLFNPSEQSNLDWSKRFRIIEGISQGLLYLHKYSRFKVIHRDLKASNILLDEAMNPKISDFGMARIFGINQTEAKTNRVVGTYGYMSPEYGLYGQFSEKSDVFSFGVLLLEIVSGKRNTNFYRTDLSLTLSGWAWDEWKEGRGLEVIDPSIRETCHPHEAMKCITVGLLCVQEIPADRPTMSGVVLMLGNGMTSLPSPKEPAFFTRRSPVTATYSNNEVTISMPEAR